MSVAETKPGEFRCPECGDVFSRAQALGAHRAQRHGYRREQADNQSKPANGAPAQEELLDSLREQIGLFDSRLGEFLPVLAKEAQERFLKGDTSLVGPFLSLYLAAN